MSVHIIEGLPGNGKTVWLTDLIFQRLKRGRHIYTNVDMDLSIFETFTPMQLRIRNYIKRSKWLTEERLVTRVILSLACMVFPRTESLSHYYHRIFDIEDLRNLSTGDIFLDEIHLYFDARDWDKLDAEDRRVLAQHRHFGLNIWGTTQAMGRVDVILRSLSESAYNIKKLLIFRVPFTKISFGWFWIRGFRPLTLLDGAGDGKDWIPQGMFGKVLFVDPSLFALYDTYQNVERPKLVGRKEIIEYTYVEQINLKKVQTNLIKK